MKKYRHNFTLLEILVAVAVLVIMMGFLFQFVISAQRVWAASTARTYMANETASPVLQLLTEDFRHVVRLAENDELIEYNDGAAKKYVEWHYENDINPLNNNLPYTKDLFFFISNYDELNDNDSGKVSAVWYHFVPPTATDPHSGKLYRTLKLNQSIVGYDTLPSNMYEAFGFTASEYNSPSDDNLLIEENLSDWIVQHANFQGVTLQSYQMPQMVRVTFCVNVPETLENSSGGGDAVTKRTFSHAFFPGGGE